MKLNNFKKKLTVIATPIGNIDEVSPRVVNALNEAYVILCEDTRMTEKLLHLLQIYDYKKLISYHNFNEANKLEEALKWINNHPTALVSDAGYPTISDPGYVLINECHRQNIGVEVINGPSSVMHAVVASGLCSTGFMFVGFLGKTKSQRVSRLNEIKETKTTFVVYEAVHRIKKTLEDIKEILGDVYVFIARELSKKNEEYYFGKISNIQDITEKGEFVIVIDNNKEKTMDANEAQLDKAMILIDELVKKGFRLKDACKLVAEDMNLSSKDLYKIKVDAAKLN